MAIARCALSPTERGLALQRWYNFDGSTPEVYSSFVPDLLEVLAVTCDAAIQPYGT